MEGRRREITGRQCPADRLIYQKCGDMVGARLSAWSNRPQSRRIQIAVRDFAVGMKELPAFGPEAAVEGFDDGIAVGRSPRLHTDGLRTVDLEIHPLQRLYRSSPPYCETSLQQLRSYSRPQTFFRQRPRLEGFIAGYGATGPILQLESPYRMEAECELGRR